jgi:hypothetical protein
LCLGGLADGSAAGIESDQGTVRWKIRKG